MDKYNIIFEYLQNEVNSGNITLELAESVNDLAYEKYVVEKKSKAEYRLDKFKKAHDYNTKDKTIDMDGKRVKFEYRKGTNKRNNPSKAKVVVRDIETDTSTFNMKHPKSHEFIIQHELGHVKDKESNYKDSYNKSEIKSSENKIKGYKYIIGILKEDYKNNKISYDEFKKKCEFLENKIKAIDNQELHNMKKVSYQHNKLRDDINDMIHNNKKPLNEHDSESSEYIADYYGAKSIKNGNKIAKKTLKELHKRTCSEKNINDHTNNLKKSDDFKKLTKDMDKTKVSDGLNKMNKDLKEIHKNGLDLRIKSLDRMDKNPNAEYIRKTKEDNNN